MARVVAPDSVKRFYPMVMKTLLLNYKLYIYIYIYIYNLKMFFSSGYSAQ